MKLVALNSRGNITVLTAPELKLLQLEVSRVFEKENLYNSREYDYWGSLTLSSTLFDYNLWKEPISEDTDAVAEIGHVCTLYLVKDDIVDYSCSLSFLVTFN